MTNSVSLLQNLRRRHLELLVALGEVSTIRAAASRLYLSQPAVSKMIQEIERQANSALIERTRRGVTPTYSGWLIIRRAKVILNEILNTEEELTAAKDGAKGLLKIGTLPLTGIYSVLKSVIELRKMLPGILVQISEGTAPELLPKLKEGKIDCFVGEALGTHDLSELRLERLHKDSIHVVSSRRHPLAGKRKLRWRDLHDQRWALPSREGLLRQAFIEAFVMEGLTPPIGEIECQSSITVQALCQLDPTILGVLRSEAALHQEMQGLLKILPVVPNTPILPLSIITRANYFPRSEALDAFTLCLKKLGSQK